MQGTLVAPVGDVVMDVNSLRVWSSIDDDFNPVLVLKDDNTIVILRCVRGDSMDPGVRASGSLADEAECYSVSLNMISAREQSRPRKSSQDS